MGKVDDYSAGRADGLRMARDIVKKTVWRNWIRKSGSGILPASMWR